jgi:fructose 1,6-bisphosphatase
LGLPEDGGGEDRGLHEATRAFEPHRLPLAEMEYTTLPKVLKDLGDRFESVE